MDIEVRRVEPGEGHLLADLRLAALQDSPSAFGSTYAAESIRAPEEWEHRAALGSSSSERTKFFAVAAGAAVGLVGGYREPDSEVVELVSMWVRPDSRRSGAGRVLVGAVITWAGSVGARWVSLWVTRGNDAAVALYASAGFVLTGDYQPLPWDPCRDELRMSLPLR